MLVLSSVDFYSKFCLSSPIVVRLFPLQGSHRLERYLNLESFLEKYLKIKSALKSTGKSLKSLEKSLNSTFFLWDLSTVDRDLSQYKIVVPLFGAAYGAPNIGTTILY